MIFKLDAEQIKKFEEWAKNHKPSKDCLGMHYKFSFIPGGLGDVVEIENLITKEVLNVTDYENW